MYVASSSRHFLANELYTRPAQNVRHKRKSEVWLSAYIRIFWSRTGYKKELLCVWAYLVGNPPRT